MRKWRLPLTYQPKIEPVLLGTCRQTIRIGRKKQVGDLIRFYVWSGKAYRSKQIDLTEYEPLTEVISIVIYPTGIKLFLKDVWIHCAWHQLHWIAALDHIVPSTGEELRDLLMSKNGKIPTEGIDAQVLRW